MRPAEELRFLILAVQREGNRVLGQALKPLGVTASQAEVLRVLQDRQPLTLSGLGSLLVCEAATAPVVSSNVSLPRHRYEPPHLLAVDGDFGPFSGTATYRLAAVDQRTTRLVNSFHLTASGVLKAAAAIAGPQLKHAVAKNLEVLKGILAAA